MAGEVDEIEGLHVLENSDSKLLLHRNEEHKPEHIRAEINCPQVAGFLIQQFLNGPLPDSGMCDIQFLELLKNLRFKEVRHGVLPDVLDIGKPENSELRDILGVGQGEHLVKLEF